jgi:hypothetical protein
MERILQNV